MRNRLIHGLLLIVLLLAGFQLRWAGIGSPSLHPDETTIARWIGNTAEHGEIGERLYPGGFFTLAAPIRRVARFGARLAHSAAYQAGRIDRLEDTWDDIRFARLLNVALGLLTGLLLHSLAFALTGNRWAALAALAFVLLDPVHVEHCHYAETDVAMLFGLALTLLLWTKARLTGHALLVLAGAAAAGWAAGTKFTLLGLLAPLLLVPFLSRQVEQYRRPLGRTFLLLALALALFAAVFAWCNPLVLQPRPFLDALANQARGLRDEMTVTLGGAGGTFGPLVLWRLRWLGRHALGLDPIFLALAGAGLVAAFAWRPYRRMALILVAAPLCLLAMHLLTAPFIRKQEFMAYLPFLSLLAVLPPALPSADSRVTRFLLHGGMIVLVLLALDRRNLESRRVAGLFGWTDPRLAARAWNARHAPDDRTAAVERNAAAAVDRSYGGIVPLRHAADLHEGFNLLDRFPADYLVRDTFAQGRGHTDPLTGQLRPRYQAVWTNIHARTRLLAQWEPFAFPRANASHAGHGAALYAVGPRELPLTPLNLTLFDPVFVSEAGRETQYGAGRPGSGLAVLLTEIPREMALGGPGPGVGRLWVTLNTEEREADIRLRAWGRTTRVRLPPWTVRTVVLAKPRWWRVPEPYARVTAWSAPLKGLVSPPCWMRLGRGPALDAAGTLGYAGHALGFYSEQAPLGPLDVFRFSVRAGDWPLALETRSEALVAFEALSRALDETKGALVVNGLAEADYDAFARVRVPELETRPAILVSDRVRKRDSGFVRTLRESLLARLGGDPARDCVSLSPFAPPLRVAQGRYRLILDVRPEAVPVADEPPAEGADAYALLDDHGRALAGGRWSDLSGDGGARLTVTLEAAREESPRLHLVTPVPRALAIRGAELRWTLRDRLEAAHQDLAACLARLALEEQDPAEADKWLKRATAEAWNRREWECLRRRRAEGKKDSLRAGFRFSPFYECEAITVDAGGERFSVALKALMDNPPPHEAQAVVRKGRHWKLADGTPVKGGLAEGETVTVTLPLPNGTPVNAGLRIRTSILTQPGSLSLDGSEETVLPLSQLLMLN